MLELSAALTALAAIFVFTTLAWIYSLLRRNVGVVDSLWSLMMLLSLAVYLAASAESGPRAPLLMLLLAAWALRLSIHITVRNHGEPEDRRYQAIRRNNEPHFWLKSLFMVFWFQGFLAWVVCLPVIAAVSGQAPPGPLDAIGLTLWLAGMFFQTVGDHQLARFRRRRDSGSDVLDTGLWRYSRHPNYFGEALVWWGFYLFALSAGAAWTLFAPLLMTFLLLRVSGVRLLEKDIGERRPAYADYVRRTNAFIPGRPRPRAAAPDIEGGLT